MNLLDRKTLLSALLIGVSFLLGASIVCADEAAPIAEHERWVTSLAFSPDGATLLTGGGESLQYRPGDIKLWDVKTGKLIATLEGHEANVWALALSPDGKTLVSSAYDGQVIVWDVDSRKPQATLDKHKHWVRSVAIASDGEHFATAGEDGTVIVWSMDGHKEVKSIEAHDAAVYSVAFSPDGKTLATASTDKTAKLWDWNSGKELAKLEGHDDAVWSIVYSSDGSRLATAGADRKIVLWSNDGEKQATLYGHTDWISCVRFSADGAKLASSSLDRTVKVWDLETAIPASVTVDEVVQKVEASRKAVADLDKQLADSQTASNAIKSKLDVIEAIVNSKEADEKVKQAQLAVDADKENTALAKVLENAKEAAKTLTADVTAKVKAAASDKEFAAALKKLQAEEIGAAIAEKVKLEVPSEAAQLTQEAAEKEKIDAEKSLTEALEKRKQMLVDQGSTLEGYKSTVWAVSFSPDNKSLASGSHKDSIKLWNMADKTERFAVAANDAKEKADIPVSDPFKK